ncbi:hypothetical protein ACQPZU_15680 [Saccharomonospora azurea]
MQVSSDRRAQFHRRSQALLGEFAAQPMEDGGDRSAVYVAPEPAD